MIQEIFTQEQIDLTKVVVLRLHDGVFDVPDDIMQRFQDGTTFIILTNDDRIELMDENDMAEHGWVRKE